MTIFLLYLFHHLFRKENHNKKIYLLPFCLQFLLWRYPFGISGLYAYLFHAFLLYQAFSDQFSEEISVLPDLFMIPIGILYSLHIGRNAVDILLSLVIPLLLYLLSLSKKIGEGDAEIFLSLSFFYPLYPLSLILFFSSLLAFLYSLHEKRERYPFVPFIYIACILVYSL